MGFQTPIYPLTEYLAKTISGAIQLPDFQRGYKWDDERIRQLIVSILRGHPLGAVMLLETGNDQVRFKPRAIEGVSLGPNVEAEVLLLDGQQRLTSLTQALTRNGVVATKDVRGKLLDRRYYVQMDIALLGDDRIEEAVVSVPGDGVIRTNFGKDVVLDLSTPEKERAEGYFPLRLLSSAQEATSWLFAVPDHELAAAFHAAIIAPASSYGIPAIRLGKDTSKAAVATVFEKVNAGGLALNVFELLTAMFAGDGSYYAQHGSDFRLNDDWLETKKAWAHRAVLSEVENTDFLQAVTMLATRKRNLADNSGAPPAVSAKREDVLKISLNDYLEWRDPLRSAFDWAAGFLADQHIFDVRFLPYPKQLVPLAAIRVVLGPDADLHGVKAALVQWFWCGILGELYGAAIETRFVRDLESIPMWAKRAAGGAPPKTIQDATFVESRLMSLRTRQGAAYKGIYALVLGNDAKDWMEDKALDREQYKELLVDIHHIFPKDWCAKNGVDDERRESIVNKTGIGAKTNRTIGGVAPSSYLRVIETKAKITSTQLDDLLATHLVPADALRSDDFDTFFTARREQLCILIEGAMGKQVPRDLQQGEAAEGASSFDDTEMAELAAEGA